jgi:Tfp pilus assembly protein PilV
MREALPRSFAAPHPRRARPRAEAGFALVEVLVSALVATLVAGAALSLLGASANQAADQRQRSAAYAVAQEDQARLRSLRVPVLNRLSQTRTVTLDGTTFTVTSTGQFINDVTGTASCGQGSASADYVKATSSVTWPGIGGRPPVVIQSIIAPPTGSLDPTHGTLTISAMNAQGAPISGLGLSGSGAGSFSGSTDSAGCAVFADQNAGNYTLTPSGAATGLVDKDGNAPGPQTISVIAGTTNTVALQYDQGGSIPVTFKTRIGSSPTLVDSSADSVVVFNTGMTTARSYGSPGGTRLSTVTATPVFPFTSPDTVYAGACTGNNPNPNSLPNPPGAAAMASVTVPSGGSAPAQVQLPALNLTVFSGSGPSLPGSPLSNAHVVVNDTTCAVKRHYFTNTSGRLADPGLPWSSNSGYTVCVDNGTRRKTTSGVLVQNLTSGTTLNVYMGPAGSGISGVCT